MRLHFVLRGTGYRTWLEWLADAFLWLGLLWFAAAVIVVLLEPLPTDEGWWAWLSTLLPLVGPSVIAAVAGYIINRVAMRGD